MSVSYAFNMFHQNVPKDIFITRIFSAVLFLLWAAFVTDRGYDCFKKYSEEPEAVDLGYKFTGKPFVWSVTQLVRFFRDPKMANLLTGPGTQQQPL